MTIFGINGFGRIGRTSFRVWWKYHQANTSLKVVNTSGSMALCDWVHLLKYDTNYGVFDQALTFEETQSHRDVTDENPVLGTITIGDHTITVTAQRDPKKIPWAAHGVETVIESTGVFVDAEKASWHLEGGAQKVILSAPGKNGVETSVLGVKSYAPESQVISNASCTTNCVAPVMAIMQEKLGVEKAFLTTIHSYTDDQNTQDNSHRKDMRRARAAAQNIIPTTTGAAKATTKILPVLDQKFDGIAVRVPTPTGSLSDIVFVSSKKTTKEEVNQMLIDSSQEKRWQGILATTNDPIVSSDIVGRPESSIVDLSLTNVIGGTLVKVISWYDNEWGYCNRLIEQITATAQV